MGVINVTPDSFSDGGQFQTVSSALRHAQSIAPYCDILDIGGESTRPGAQPVAPAEELDRVLPVIRALREHGITLPISIDTTKAQVAEMALKAGANIINDVSAGRFEPDIFRVARDYGASIVLMHMQGQPRTMQINPQYKDVVQEVKQFLQSAIEIAMACGVNKEAIAIDPGIGFGKTLEHNLLLLRHLSQLTSLGCPLLVGVSRKSFIGTLCDQPDPQQRVWGTTAACAVAIMHGAHILRVHDARAIYDVCKVVDAIQQV